MGNIARHGWSWLRPQVLCNLRILSRQPIWALAIVLSVGLGVGISSAVFSVVRAVLLYPLPFEAPEELVVIWSVRSEDVQRGIGVEVRQSLIASPDVAGVGWFAIPEASLDVSDESAPAALVSDGLFSVLGAGAVLGRTILPGDSLLNPEIVVISSALWKGRFAGRPDVIGKSVKVGGRPHEVVGVMPGDFFFPHTNILAWKPLPTSMESLELPAIVRLSPGVHATTIQTGLSDLPGSPFPVPEAIDAFMLGGYERPLWFLYAATLLLLVLANINAAVLLLSRGVSRSEELAIRSALGARPGQLASVVLTETAIFAGLGGIVGLGLAAVIREVIRHQTLTAIPRIDAAGTDPLVLASAACLSLACGVVMGTLPAVRAARGNVAEQLKLGNATVSSDRGTGIIREALVSGEIGLAVALVFTAVLMVSSFLALSTLDWGFEAARTIYIRGTPDGPARQNLDSHVRFLSEALARLNAIPGVERAGTGNGVPIRWAGTPSVRIHVDGEDAGSTKAWKVSPGYFQALGIQLRGWDFPEELPTGPKPVIVTENLAAQLWPGDDAIGQRISLKHRMLDDPAALRDIDPEPREVIGVVSSFRMIDATVPPSPDLFIDYRQQFPVMAGAELSVPLPTFVVRVADDHDLNRIIPAVRLALESDPQFSISELALMRDIVSAASGGEGIGPLRALIAAIFSGTALLLAGLGLFASMSYWLEQRKWEMGVRMALGATPYRIARLLVQRSLRTSLLGGLLGFALSWAGTQIMSVTLFGVGPADPAILIKTITLLLGTVSLATLLPLVHAVRLTPVTALCKR